MSTPISALPNTPPSGAAVADPEIMAVLQEVEHEVQAAAQAAQAAQATAQVAQARMGGGGGLQHILLPPSPSCANGPLGAVGCMWNAQYAQYAAVATVVAVALFFPAAAAFDGIYAKVPKLGALLVSNDRIVRAALFAVVIYLILWKLQI